MPLLSTLVLAALPAYAATVYDSEAAFQADAAHSCGLTTVDFEETDLPVGTMADEYYAESHGVHFSALVRGLEVSSTVGGIWGLTRDSRAGLAAFDPDIIYVQNEEDAVPSWIWLEFDSPVSSLGLWVIDSDHGLEWAAWTDLSSPTPAEEGTLDVAGHGVSGGVFTGRVFSDSVRAVLLISNSVDEFAIDDIQFIPPECRDADGDGQTPLDGDCDDDDPSILLGAEETCDGRDEDCDGEIDEGTQTTWYIDEDGDGWGDERSGTVGCSPPDWAWLDVPGDCDDSDESVAPDAEEICDELDNDCNGEIDEGLQQTWYQDSDQDGFGDPDSAFEACHQPEWNWGLVGDDCDDNDEFAAPGQKELCDGVDNDCDGSVPADEVDDDRDDWMVCEGDSRDDMAACYPGAPEVNNGFDCDLDGTASGGTIHWGCATSGGKDLSLMLALLGPVLLFARRRGRHRVLWPALGLCMSLSTPRAAEAGSHACPDWHVGPSFALMHDHSVGWAGMGLDLSYGPPRYTSMSLLAEVRVEYTPHTLWLTLDEQVRSLYSVTALVRWHPLVFERSHMVLGGGAYLQPHITGGPVLSAGWEFRVGEAWLDVGVRGWIHDPVPFGVLGGELVGGFRVPFG